MPPIDPIITITIPTLTDADSTDISTSITDLTDTIPPMPTTNIDTETPSIDGSEAVEAIADDKIEGNTTKGDTAGSGGATATERPKLLRLYYGNESFNIFEDAISKVKETALDDALTNPVSISQPKLYIRPDQWTRPQKLILGNQQREILNLVQRRVRIYCRSLDQKYRRLLAKYKKSLQQQRRLIKQIKARRKRISNQKRGN